MESQTNSIQIRKKKAKYLFKGTVEIVEIRKKMKNVPQPFKCPPNKV